ncbi:uncharacterized protein LOC123313236 [Coccinella septempunctata]|uniref:uncharacterized protein LOC123313236 n=1 Tax=Coccinella septempunctata TaxID=41139 RepID=UPI001D061B57|nr:uncharacterized protein LOC123313236 [Coccinella septempunctata]
MHRTYVTLILIIKTLSAVKGQYASCYTCIGEGLDSCAVLANRRVERCRNDAVGCAIAAGTLSSKKQVVTVERTCLYVDPKLYCDKIKRMVGTQHEQDYYCWTCRYDKCNSKNLTSIINRLQPGPVTVENYPENPTANPCRK